MIAKLKTLAVCLLISISAAAQSEINYEGETINRLDKDGKKYGVWKLFDKDKGNTVVVKMQNDVFASNIEYYRDGKLTVTQDKDDLSKYVFYIDSKPVPVKIITAENDTRKVVQNNGKVLDEINQKVFFSVLEVKTMYYGGEATMRKFISNAIAGDWDGSGSANIQIKWDIDKSGRIENIKVIKSTNEAFNEEAIRIIQKMPRWQPGFSNGRFLKGMYNTGIRFMSS